MLKLMSMHKRDNKGIVKSDFVISCLAFRCSIKQEDPHQSLKTNPGIYTFQSPSPHQNSLFIYFYF